jgi:hypothetical protein
MTPAQTAWLAKNKSYSAVNYGTRFERVGILHADGTFELRERGKIPRITVGAFEVGVKAVARQSGEPPSQLPK